MKTTQRLMAALFLCALAAFGQGLETVNHANAQSVIPWTQLPYTPGGTCKFGQMLTRTDQAVGSNTYTCDNNNTWVAFGSVSSVYGRTGAVTATTGDYTAAQVTNALDATAGIPAGTCLPVTMTASGSITAFTLVVVNTSGTVQTSGTGGGAFGVAQNTVTTGNPVKVCFNGSSSVLMDATSVTGNVAITSTTTGGQAHDSAATTRNSIGLQVGVIGAITSGCTGVGCTATVALEGVSRTGRQILASYLPTSVVTAITTPGVLFTSPVTITSNTAALALVNQSANTVLAGPTSGAAATPTMRALVPADFPGIVTNRQSGTAYTLVASDMGKFIIFTNSSTITVTVPASLTAGFYCNINQAGTGVVSIVAGGGVTLNLLGSLMSTAGQNATAFLWQSASNVYTLGGSLQ